jgi:hypothetical protein
MQLDIKIQKFQNELRIIIAKFYVRIDMLLGSIRIHFFRKIIWNIRLSFHNFAQRSFNPLDNFSNTFLKI